MRFIDVSKTLDLPEEFTEADVRRAYARKIKSTRPDEAPEDFQLLVGSRDVALLLARRRVMQTAAGEADVADVVAPPALDQTAAPHLVQSATAVDASTNEAVAEAETVATGTPTSDSPPPQVETADAAVTPTAVLDALQLSLDALLANNTPFDQQAFEALLLKLPVGAVRVIEPDVIRVMSTTLNALYVEPHEDAAVTSFEHLGVSLASTFNWTNSDRVLRAVLPRVKVDRFEYFLSSSFKRLAPGTKTRFSERTLAEEFGGERHSIVQSGPFGPTTVFAVLAVLAMVWALFHQPGPTSSDDTARVAKVAEVWADLQPTVREATPQTLEALYEKISIATAMAGLDAKAQTSVVTLSSQNLREGGKPDLALALVGRALGDAALISHAYPLREARADLWLEINSDVCQAPDLEMREGQSSEVATAITLAEKAALKLRDFRNLGKPGVLELASVYRAAKKTEQLAQLIQWIAQAVAESRMRAPTWLTHVRDTLQRCQIPQR